MNWKEKAKELSYLPVMLPLAFALLFFVLLPPRFAVTVQVANVAGAGQWETRSCAPKEGRLYHPLTGDLNPEAEQIALEDMDCDVQRLTIRFPGIEQVEMREIVVRFHGVEVNRFPAARYFEPVEEKYYTGQFTQDGAGVLYQFVSRPSAVWVEVPWRLVPAWFWGPYALATLAIAAALALLARALTRRWPMLRWPLVTCGVSLVPLLAGTWFCGGLCVVLPACFLINWLLTWGMGVLLGALTLPWLGLTLSGAALMLWCVANYFVILFRGMPIQPSDLKVMDTAMSVAGGYEYTLSVKMAVGIALTVLYAALAAVFARHLRREEQGGGWKRQMLRRGAGAALALVMLICAVGNETFRTLPSRMWASDAVYSYYEQGVLLPFLKRVLEYRIREPKGYSAKKVAAWLKEYQEQKQEPAQGTQPVNVIMVMNESFSDLRSVGLDPSVDVMPFFDSLQEDVKRGWLYVPVSGGGTCNTEFEALTGNCCTFLPQGTYPFVEFIYEPMFSLGTYFRSLGMPATAMHSGKAANWSRNKIYPYLGFDRFYGWEEYGLYTNRKRLNYYATDKTDYQMLEGVAAEHQGEAQFLFNVTIQNHGGYTNWGRIQEAETLQGHDELPEDARIYLSLLRYSDKALKKLINDYKNCGEPTLILFFGDHQPGLSAEANEAIYKNVDNQLDGFCTPFLLWTNYDTEEEEGDVASANYLPLLLLERGNFPLPPYLRMLKEVYERYPVIEPAGVLDAQGNACGSVEELADDPLIQKYQQIQYANMTGALDEAWYQVS